MTTFRLIRRTKWRHKFKTWQIGRCAWLSNFRCMILSWVKAYGLSCDGKKLKTGGLTPVWKKVIKLKYWLKTSANSSCSASISLKTKSNSISCKIRKSRTQSKRLVCIMSLESSISLVSQLYQVLFGSRQMKKYRLVVHVSSLTIPPSWVPSAKACPIGCSTNSLSATSRKTLGQIQCRLSFSKTCFQPWGLQPKTMSCLNLILTTTNSPANLKTVEVF